jgi:hypothetical protein
MREFVGKAAFMTGGASGTWLALGRALAEGVSALSPVLCHLYGLRIFVDSDRSTVLQAALRRGGGAFERQ